MFMVEARKGRLLGKSERNINGDCRGHDFDRPRQLPHTWLLTPSRRCVIQLVCASVVESSASGRIVKKGSVYSPMKRKAHCRPKKSSPVRRLYDMYIQHSTNGREAQLQRKPGANANSTFRQLLTGAHLSHENKEVRKVNLPHTEHAGEHDCKQPSNGPAIPALLANTETADMSKEAYAVMATLTTCERSVPARQIAEFPNERSSFE